MPGLCLAQLSLLSAQNLMMQLPRLLDRLDELGLRRVDGEVLWSNVVTNQAPQDQVSFHLD